MDEAKTVLPAAVIEAPERIWKQGGQVLGTRAIAEEVPIAIVIDASSEAVMMASPADLEDFAVGFSLTEGLIESVADIRRIEIAPQAHGVEARLWLHPGRFAKRLRRRAKLAPSGCGLCGVESLDMVESSLRRVTADFSLSARQVAQAVAGLSDHQTLSARTRAVHAAGYWTPEDGYLAVREDVGRHNALDKLAGALLRDGTPPPPGAVVLSSRVSYEMAQKTLAIGAPILIAISAPTGMALRVAEAGGLTVVAVARADGFEVFTHPDRIRD
jgi:FdhD protein